MDCSNWYYVIIGVLLAIAAQVLRPHHAACPGHWHNNGIRPSGEFLCTQNPVGDPDYDGTYGRPDRSVVPSGCLYGRLHCTGGQHPIVVDDRTVGCQR